MALVLAPAGYIGVLFIIVLVFVMIRRMVLDNRAGKTGKHHAAAGNALMRIEPIFRPSREHIIEAREHEEVEEDAGSDPPGTDDRK